MHSVVRPAIYFSMRGLGPICPYESMPLGNTAVRFSGRSPVLRNVCATPAGIRTIYGPTAIETTIAVHQAMRPWKIRCASTVACVCKGGPPCGRLVDPSTRKTASTALSTSPPQTGGSRCAISGLLTSRPRYGQSLRQQEAIKSKQFSGFELLACRGKRNLMSCRQNMRHMTRATRFTERR
jgi:hypothetical protein